jgi:hypothetical protein
MARARKGASGLEEAAAAYLPQAPVLRATVADLDRKFALDRKEIAKSVAKFLAGSAAYSFGGAQVLPAVASAVVEGAANLVTAVKRERSPEGRL